MQPKKLLQILMFGALFSPICLQADDNIKHEHFPEYTAPLIAQSQKDYDYVHKHLWLAYRFYAEQRSDSFAARLKLSCQQTGMAYSYQDFVNANKKFATTDDLDFIVTDKLLKLNASQHDNQCRKYLGPHLQLEESPASEAVTE